MSRGHLPQKAVLALGGYLKRHPEEVLRVARNAARLKLGVPVVALHWVLRELGGSKIPKDFEIEARAPGIYVSGSFELMKTPLRGEATVFVDRVDMRSDALLIDLRFEGISLSVTDARSKTPISALLQAGALDLSRPGDLMSFMPQRPNLVVEAQGNVLTLDLLRHPKLSAERARNLVALLVQVVGIETVQTDDQHLDVAFSALPGGAAEAFERLKKLF